MSIKVLLEVPDEVTSEQNIESKPEPSKEEVRLRKYLRENYPAKVQISFEWPWWAPSLDD